MTNKINQIFTLADGMKFLVVNQAIYKEKNYYFVARVNDDESHITGEYRIVEETTQDGKTYLTTVTDGETIRIITEYLQPKEDYENSLGN